MPYTHIAQNIATVRDQIKQSCVQHQRQLDTVTLLAVSKTKPAEAVRAAFEAGQVEFGENYLQEALDKQQALADLPIVWHFIGPIQSNKTRAIAEHFDWVHSVDRLKVAQRLNDQRPDHLPPLNICLQVNISQEESKSGLSLAELPEFAAQIAQMPRLCLRGLMAIPAPCDNPVLQRKPFAEMKQALLTLQSQYSSLDSLSMGMTDDMDAAIAEGSTMVRIGTAIFGARDYTASH
ncbi:hypothetical protein SAMN02745127_03179 [Oceanospirillum multiglobuliferum]|uniref:Pyridoxal phosphate homeostasis protein n=1 Tax=Oceanospirillum multiglobuliferum TaxID=64969 RepID=A0A1T4SME2_9GAMM|nr:YggS family pyridoxal phosphate-dependent enzyme [Oceanospirillum multiglobuliferum]OPX54180.1 YggS family pyridoxal phosphate enzyme [Oceanospirillum multiglobuliferum]SKA29345.1 hypothetical protein SAMN02745127_03179 [Oceanospirillum multiglobuliferum]